MANDQPMTFLERYAGDSIQQERRITALFLTLTLGFGLTQVWVCRYHMDPDSMDYLDIARELALGHWSAIANGYWGTLDSLLMAPLFRFRLSPEMELSLAHLEQILVLVFAFFSFRFFLIATLDSVNLDIDKTVWLGLPKWGLRALGYTLFMWSSLILILVSGIGADLLVSAFVYLAAALLCRLRRDSSLVRFIVFGLTLGLGYWSKAIMFPISLAFFAASMLKLRSWKKNLSSILSFAIVAAPLVATLSVPRGRFTFGDSGKLAYSTLVSPGGRVINWQGDPAASGVPKHSTRRIAVDPPIYEFSGPIGGTYPPTYDPSYWNEGRRTTFSLWNQFRLSKYSAERLGEILLSEPSLIVGFVFLLLWSPRRFALNLAERWDVITISVAIIALYMLVLVESRYVAPFVVLVWFSLFLCLRHPGDLGSQRIAGWGVVALAMMMQLSFVSNMAKTVVKGCPDSVENHFEVARKLALPPGTRVAVIGYGNWSYWAHFAKVKIVADIMPPDDSFFWTLPEERRQTLYAAFRMTGAERLIGQPPTVLAKALDSRWKQVGATEYYVYSLNP